MYAIFMHKRTYIIHTCVHVQVYVYIYLDAAPPHQPEDDKNEDEHYAYRKDHGGQEEIHHRQAPIRNPTFKSTFTTYKQSVS
jgi:hypothetical protein